MIKRALLALTSFALLAACGAARTSAPTGPAVQLEETRIVARHTSGGELELDSYDASQLFQRAYELGQRGECAAAVELYDRVVAEFPSSRYLSPALYNAGLCLKDAGDLAGAVERWSMLLERVPDAPDAKHARFLMTAALVELERWEPALDSAELLLDRDDLRSDERLEAMARRAEALFGLRRIEDAERAARDALAYYRTRQGEELIADEYFAAAANFVLAETIRTRSEALALPDSDVVTQRETLDRRAQLLLDAQRAYFDTMRHTDARWAAAAGYRIGAMYEHLYRAITEAPVPPPPPDRPLTGDALEIYRREYRGQLADRVRPLVRHAIRYWELTLLMVERTGVRSDWVERTRTELDRARQLLLGGPLSDTEPEPARALGSPSDTPDRPSTSTAAAPSSAPVHQ
ncbi:tetratricopeptide repeat protein [Sandaracinus amylolyticus]|uniref:tetratricopeptide repeat protein n=1 Tax=Sandaracinus amylolyticus TaxID=927083 RepID=UPI001F2C5329|nr:tetratricopeptide repeat protein [Sandaracinus amylolyticus]UJR81830.1 TPR domain protein, putative component of TonB system [Sandaracinus amylolyticus]